MATSSITRNFVISGKKDTEKFAKALKKSYEMSSKKTKNIELSYRDATPEDISRFLKKYSCKK